MQGRKVKTMHVKPLMSIKKSDTYEGKHLTQKDCKVLIDYDCDVYDLESGKCLAKFRKAVIPGKVMSVAYDNYLAAATINDNRGVAAGKDEEGYAKKLRVRKDTVTNQRVSKQFVNSGILGFVDRSPRFPYCRATAFTGSNHEQYKAGYPIIKFVDNMYKELMPVQHKKQMEMVKITPKDWVIPGTSFTTVTVNKDFVTAVHKDAGDYREGFGNLTAMRRGKFNGCHFVLVRWGVGFDMQNGDVLLVDVHQWHGNTPLIPVDKLFTRLSLVMYYREHMSECGTAEQEIERVKNRKKGDPIYEKKV
jgi:hypothetical protein